MERREFLKRGVAAAAGVILHGAVPAEGVILHGTVPAEAAASDAASDTTTAHLVPSLPELDRLTGHVILRGQAGYDDASLERNTRISSSPAVIVFCRTARDVSHAVKWAGKHGVPFRVRCGRHSYEGYSSLDDGLVIDVSDLRRVRFDRRHGTALIGAGMSLAKLYEALWPHRVTVPGGSCPTVGVAGLALGGGYGLLARHFGLTCDSVTEVEVVLADGSIVRANAASHPDLLWACRGGGGGNFGVVTAFRFRVHPIETVSLYHFTWQWSDLEAVLNAWQSWAPSMDERLTSILQLKSFADGTISSTGQFVGSVEELNRLLGPLRAAGSPKEVLLESMSYMDAMQTLTGQKPERQHLRLHWQGENTHFKHSSDYGDRVLDADGVKALRHALEIAPGSACLVQFEAYGGAINRIPPEATAFCHRAGTLFNLQYQSYWGRHQDEAPYVAWVRAFRQSMQPFVSGRAYGNYCDAEIANWPQAYYGDNLERLAKVKAKYDPLGLFRFPQALSAAGSSHS